MSYHIHPHAVATQYSTQYIYNMVEPLSGLRDVWLRACCSVAEGAEVVNTLAVANHHYRHRHRYPTRFKPTTVTGTTEETPTIAAMPATPAAVAAADSICQLLLDERIHAFGGVEGRPRSLASVWSGIITRMLAGGVGRITNTRVVVVDDGQYRCLYSVAVSGSGALLVSDSNSGTLLEHSAIDGSRLRTIGSRGFGQRQFNQPHQVFVAADGFVFVADTNNRRVQVLTPDLRFHATISGKMLITPKGVIANSEVVLVSDAWSNNIVVFRRWDGVYVSTIKRQGKRSKRLNCPVGMCFMSKGTHFAVSELYAKRVSVFDVGGAFIRCIGVGVLKSPCGVACSAANELVVVDRGNSCLRLFSDHGKLLKTFGYGVFMGVSIQGPTIWVCSYTHADGSQVRKFW